MCWQHHGSLTGGVTSSTRARLTPRHTRVRRVRAACLLAAVAAIATFAYQLLASSSSTDPSPSTVDASISAPSSGLPQLRSRHGRVLDEANGAIPDGTTVFDDTVPGVANLDPVLLASLRQAATDAAADGVEFLVDSGWRSADYQEQLLQQAIMRYGSEPEAARWVATPTRSAHVSGDAVDIGPSRAAAWLSQNGAEYGLCQIYRNEPWHYELRPVDDGCPAMYDDPTHDPRNQQ